MTSLFERFASNAARHPEKAALIYSYKGDWTTVTYAQLLDSTQRFISGLLACSLIPGMRAALMTPPSADFFALAFALLKLGIIPIIVDPAIGLKKVGECLAESQPDIFIGNTLTHGLRKLFGWGKESIKHNLTITQISRFTYHESPVTDYFSPVTDSLPAAILYTSGSTGLPKGAVYTQANFSAQLDMLAKTFNISPDEIDLPAFPLYALIDTLLGVTSVIPDINFPVPGKTDPEKVLDAIQEFNVTNMFASPVVLDILVRKWSRHLHCAKRSAVQVYAPQSTAGLLDHHRKLNSLKRVITAGAPATIPLQIKFRELLDEHTDLFGIYGATETLPVAKVESREIFAVKDKTGQGAGVCLGRPVENVNVRIISITDDPIEEWNDALTVESNIVGEITVQSAATTRGYIHREDANRLSKISNGDEIIHRMGDVGYFDEQGRLWYCGRKSHRVIINEGVLFTEQIEGIFNAHPLVYRTALVGVKKEPVLWVELVKNDNKEKIKDELMSLARSHPQASKIKKFLFMKKFPTDVRHNSKIIREELTRLAEKRLA
jgi:acyl-CoA synthetase (AMP-forming)/AMP-acid ligase II